MADLPFSRSLGPSLAAAKAAGGLREAPRSRRPLVTLGLALAAVALYLLPNGLALLCWDRQALASGEWWRLLSGHFIHSSDSHLLWDLLAFTLAAGWLERHSRRQLLLTLLLGVVAINLLLGYASSLVYYCGLSGLLFAPLTRVVVQLGCQSKGLLSWVPALLCLCKLCWELASAETLFVWGAWPAYPWAHLAGAAAGLLCLTFCKIPRTG